MQLATVTPMTKFPRIPQSVSAMEFLRTAPVFRGLPDSVLHRISESARVVPVRRGTRIFTEGQQPTAFYIVKSGWVRTIRETALGHGVLFEILRPGDTVGVMAFADQGAHAVTAVAGNQTELIAIPGSTFLSLASQYPDLQRSFIGELGRRMRSASEWQVLSGLGVDARIARVLLRMIEWNGEPVTGGIQVQKNFTCQELADMVGCAVETGIRMLSSWRAAGWLETQKSSIVVHDLNKLCEIAGQELNQETKARFAAKPRPRVVAHRACA